MKDVMFHKIDIATWKRKELYHFYQQYPCSFNITVNIEITSFLEKIKSQGNKLYPMLISILSMVVNSLQEFKMSYDKDGKLGYYEEIFPLYTIPHPEQELFSVLWSEFNPNIDQMSHQINQDITQYKDDLTYFPKSPPLNCFNISCVPELSFTSLNLNLTKGHEFLSPCFTFGKYFTENEKVLLPFAIQVNHIACDGFHVTRLVKLLQQELNNFGR